jgi:hypothetical protein
MAAIKSALELALERSETIKSDSAGAGQYEAKQRGKRAANEYVNKPSGPGLETALEHCPKAEMASFRQGCFEALLARLTLPPLAESGGDSNPAASASSSVEAAVKGLQMLLNNPRFTGMTKQFSQVIGRYLSDGEQYDKGLRQQYEPKLRQKEEMLSRQLGQPVHLDPFQDPEFVAFYKKNMDALKANYQGVIDQLREAARSIFQA